MGDSIPQSIGVTTFLADVGEADPCETRRRQIPLPIADVQLIDADTWHLAVMAKWGSRLPLAPC